ncbi:siderophore-interacting protein [Pseudovibrio sp. Tun.PSC04-5.I4]|uniref:siderophore-interacting protein n=1 Tax=Pseudovibrio sp. Tun.PSC04-5.I4 TaxID=1798213 RepID=UPI00087E26FD|nr:siderophore-interacting protein [Pseudovibrio sp. Tun.PSC04-5.I4]SDQ15757.1 NADPH-dependent ferric siderophore reductase, contains FAD-binding and SIP domains [Pseudovibrio sp. Tun.PSC04-5.I4]
MIKTGNVKLSAPHQTFKELQALCEGNDVAVDVIPSGLIATTAFGIARFEEKGTSLFFTINSENANQCAQLVPAVVSALEHCSGVDISSLVWEDTQTDRRPLHNFRELIVTETEMLSPRMKRIWFTAPNLAVYADELHLRLLFPERQREKIQWPYYDATGGIKDPETDNPISRRAYTVRYLEPGQDRMAIDFYLHDCDGPGSQFAKTAKSGDVAGVSGPGGGAIPTASKLFLAGDETAFPAIFRIMENRRSSPPLKVLLLLENKFDEILIPEEFKEQVTCLYRSEGQSDDWERLALEHARQNSGGYSWIAGEKPPARRIRKAMHEYDDNRDNYRVSGYWR